MQANAVAKTVSYIISTAVADIYNIHSIDNNHIFGGDLLAQSKMHLRTRVISKLIQLNRRMMLSSLICMCSVPSQPVNNQSRDQHITSNHVFFVCNRQSIVFHLRLTGALVFFRFIAATYKYTAGENPSHAIQSQLDSLHRNLTLKTYQKIIALWSLTYTGICYSSGKLLTPHPAQFI